MKRKMTVYAESSEAERALEEFVDSYGSLSKLHGSDAFLDRDTNWDDVEEDMQ